MKINNLKKRLKSLIWRKIKNKFYDFRIKETAIIQNINYSSLTNQKKAVVSYLTDSYTKDWEHNNIGRTQPIEILSITKTLADAGYCIDVVGCNDTKTLYYLENKNYDLIFGFGEVFFRLTEKQPQAMSILYMTEHHPEFADKAEKDRIAYYYKRHKKRARIVRSGNYYKPHHFKKPFSEVITMSELEPFKNNYQNPYPIFPTGVVNTNFVFNKKDHKTTRKNFLWLGSYGAIHKGLDILLDVFENRDDITLHIAGLSEEDEKLLNPKKRENIINHGYINIKSKTFLEVVQTCSFIILPSCSEGCSTSITTGMLHGLIPIVIRNTGFNRLNENAFFLDDHKVSYVDQKLTEISKKTPLELENYSKRVNEFAKNNFSTDSFENNFKKIIKNILKLTE
ncbi:glycosyltransferase [uncultured Maribacter sp.]|uniref:glycosyltransferase n=1 Tax=uncultured Maribacter sp. TaxID=431308 RepID=UPI00263947D9|nr:glycosyltransferase [uncultured Maribacter sp.]